jgi:hypothetical protein
MDKVLEVYDLDVVSDTATRETFEILREAVTSQVAARERSTRPAPRVSQAVEMRSAIGAEENDVVEQYFSGKDETE